MEHALSGAASEEGGVNQRARQVAACAALFLAACTPTPLTPTPLPPTAVLPTLVRPTAAPLPTLSAPPPVTVAPQPTATAAPADSLPLFQQAITADRDRYQFAAAQGARFSLTPDGRSFYILWLPPGADADNPPPLIATLHGHASWAFDEFFLWQPYAAQHGYGLLALQWWFGGGEAASDYYQPQEIYRLLAAGLAAQNAQPQRVLLHGFSRAATNVYAITALDRASGNNYFGLTIANAGGAAEDFPANVEILSGQFGPQPFAGTHWVLYCGQNDPNPDRDGCPAMERTRNWLTRFGGAVDLLIKDSRGGHSGFHQTPTNVERALDVFAQRLGQ